MVQTVNRSGMIKSFLWLMAVTSVPPFVALPNTDLNAATTRHQSNGNEQLTGHKLAHYLNKVQKQWKAEFNEHHEYRKYFLMDPKYLKTPPNTNSDRAPLTDFKIEIPKQFDAREKWPYCKSLWEIRDQSNCGSCWAIASAEVITDRMCIATSGSVQVPMSAIDIVSCCDFCGYKCHGGWSLRAFKYWKLNGIVTGGNYSDQSSCKPYPFQPCAHHTEPIHHPSCSGLPRYEAPKCERKCSSRYTEQFHREYEDDLHFGRSAYEFDGAEEMQKEIMINGPITVSFNVYPDFLVYKSGVYRHVYGGRAGGHVVKVIGWGEVPASNSTEDPIPYWIMANSWNTDWGENGYFRILRGKNECDLERGASAGMPDTMRYHEDLAITGGILC